MSLHTKFKAALEAGSRKAVIDALAAQPNTTVAELRKLSHADPILAKLFKSISIVDLFGPITKGPRITTRAKRDRVQFDAMPVNTRTAEERAAYDHDLLKAVKSAKGSIGAAAIIAAAGGTSLQARTGLARLIADGKITWTGKARGTKYEAL